MSSKYTTIKEFLSSIILMNVVGALVKPKGINNHLKLSSLDLSVFFHTSFVIDLTCKYYRSDMKI